MAHGHGIAQYTRRTINDALQVEEGSLYPALQCLAINGWVKAEWGQSEKNQRLLGCKLNSTVETDFDSFNTAVPSLATLR